MNKLPIKIILIGVIAIVTLGFGINYFFTKVDESSKNGVKVGNRTIEVPEGSIVLDPFPVTSDSLYRSGRNREWHSRLFQGVIKEYGEKDGISYVTVTYSTNENEPQEREAKILLQIKKELIPQAIKAHEKVDSPDSYYNVFKDLYVEFLQIHRTRELQKTDDNAVFLMKLEGFKETFAPDTALAFRVFDNYPDKVDRTNEYCNTNDLLNCVYSDMTDIYTGRENLNNFWKNEPLPEDRYLVPLDIIIQLVDTYGDKK